MKRWLIILICGLAAPLLAQQPAAPVTVNFRAVDIYIDSGNTPLAAYQLDFSITNGFARIVGIEGGQSPAFKEPPFYDPKAMQEERVVIAAFSTEKPEHLPKGKTRVATVHLLTNGTEPLVFQLKLETAGDASGNKISVTATCEEKKTP